MSRTGIIGEHSAVPLRWINNETVKLHMKSRVPNLEPQFITMMAHSLSCLSKQIPIKKHILIEEGEDSPIAAWYCLADNRLFEILVKTCNQEDETQIVIYTDYSNAQDRNGDWSVLLEMSELPLNIRKVIYVESRNKNPSNVIYRRTSKGWCQSIYKSKTLSEAEELLAFLKQDDWNDNCFIGIPEPEGKWVTFQNEVENYGYGNTLNVGLRFACDWSIRYHGAEMIVKDVSGKNSESYRIVNGIVQNPSKLY